MKSLKKIGAILLMLAVFVAFSPLTFDGEVYAASIKLSKKTVYMSKGSTYKLKVKGTKKKVKWQSSDSSIVSVSKKGKLKAKAYGTATITAKVKGKTLKCKVKVERKGEKNARKLRDYLIKYGKKSGKNRYIKKSYHSGDKDEGTTTTITITASTKDKILTFRLDQSTIEPPEGECVVMQIDLMNGTTAVKSGTLKYVYEDGYGIEKWDEYYGTVTTSFRHTFDDTADDMVEGMTITKCIMHEDGSTSEETDQAVLNKVENLRAPAVNLGWAFPYWNKLMASKSTLKKAKITMKTLGFTKF